MEDLKTSKKTIGIKQTLKAVQKGKVSMVYVAQDAEKRIVNDLLELCRLKNITVQYVDSMQKLGKASGIDVGASAVGLLTED